MPPTPPTPRPGASATPLPFVLVTGNRNKLLEARRILGRDLEAVELDLPEIQSLDLLEVLELKAEEAYRRLLSRHEMDPGRCVFIEDSAHNLEPAAALGMTTVWVQSETRWAGDGHGAAYVDHVVEDLGAWLEALTAPGSAERPADSPVRPPAASARR